MDQQYQISLSAGSNKPINRIIKITDKTNIDIN